MKIFQDVFSGAELISDSYPMAEVYDGVIYEVKSNMLVKGEENIDIGCGNAFAGEAEAEAPPADVYKVNNVLDAFPGYEKDENMTSDFFKTYIKTYMGKIVAHLTAKKPERLDAFKAGVKKFVSWVLANFDDISLYYYCYSAILSNTIQRI